MQLGQAAEVSTGGFAACWGGRGAWEQMLETVCSLDKGGGSLAKENAQGEKSKAAHFWSRLCWAQMVSFIPKLLRTLWRL